MLHVLLLFPVDGSPEAIGVYDEQALAMRAAENYDAENRDSSGLPQPESYPWHLEAGNAWVDTWDYPDAGPLDRGNLVTYVITTLELNAPARG